MKVRYGKGGKEINKTLIRWVSGVIITLMICFTLIIINNNPYEIRLDLTTNDNFKEVIKDLKDFNKYKLNYPKMVILCDGITCEEIPINRTSK